MKISIEWLKDYVDIDLSAQQVSDILSDLGFPLEGIIETDNGEVIDVEITSNRGDCLSYLGVAREIAVVTGKKLKVPEINLDYMDKDVSEFVDVSIAEPSLCNRYCARYIEGVKVGESPDWMKRRLESVGLRSVNNVVDATNYAMLEVGQPPHAFDYDKLSGERIVVRKAIVGEELTAIDSTQCKLTSEMLVIADENAPVAIAGVMGSLDTEVSETTTNILLEEAHFAPVSVRTTGRALGLNSDAMFRFERRVDVEQIEFASQRTAQLIQLVAGGKIAKGAVDNYPTKASKPQVTMRLERLNKLIGIEYDSGEIETIFNRLGFDCDYNSDTKVFTANCPTWRHDITREVDLIEEVVRVCGYDRIPTEKKINIEVAPVDKRHRVVKKIGAFLNACGFFETINVTFTDDKTAKIFTECGADGHMGVKDVTRKNANLLRQTLISSLCSNMQSNYNARNTNCKLFEVADTFEMDGETLCEKTKVAIVCDSELRFLRGAFEGLVRSLDKSAVVKFTPANICWASVGAEVFINDKKIGVAGIVNDAVRKAYDFKNVAPTALEVDLEALMEIEGGEFKIDHLPKFPSIERALSIIVDEPVSWTEISDTVSKVAPKELEKLSYIDTYRGKQIASGKKSVTLSLLFRDEDGTLTHERVDSLEAPIVKSLNSQIGAEIRTL